MLPDCGNEMVPCDIVKDSERDEVCSCEGVPVISRVVLLVKLSEGVLGKVRVSVHVGEPVIDALSVMVPVGRSGESDSVDETDRECVSSEDSVAERDSDVVREILILPVSEPDTERDPVASSVSDCVGDSLAVHSSESETVLLSDVSSVGDNESVTLSVTVISLENVCFWDAEVSVWVTVGERDIVVSGVNDEDCVDDAVAVILAENWGLTVNV